MSESTKNWNITKETMILCASWINLHSYFSFVQLIYAYYFLSVTAILLVGKLSHKGPILTIK